MAISMTLDNVELPELRVSKPIRVRHIQGRDNLIGEAKLTLEEMARQVGGITRQGMEEYIIRSGQHGEWIARRQEFLQEHLQEQKAKEQQHKRDLYEIISLFKTFIFNWAQKEGRAYEKAIEHMYLKPRSTYTSESLITIFQRCENANNRGEKISLEKIGEGLGIYPSGIRNILRTVGLKPMYDAPHRHVITNEKKEAIHRGFGLPSLSIADIAHLLDVSYGVVSRIFQKMGIRPQVKYVIPHKTHQETFRLLSQIYEALDIGFTKNETAELLSTNQQIIDNAIKNRTLYEPVLINALRILYASMDIKKPYKI